MDPIVVIGAGPGGTVAAALMARAGLHTILVEQSRFPRDKVCGECISALGWEVLTRLGAVQRLRDEGAVELRRTRLHSPDGRVAELELPQPMWGVSRAKLDSMLLDSAIEAGAEIRVPVRCEAVGPAVRLRDLTSNVVSELKAHIVILADGKSALMHPRPRLTGDLGLKAHFEGVAAPSDAIALFGVDGHYGGIAPIEMARWNVAMSVPRQRVEQTPDLDELFDDVLCENRALAQSFVQAQRISPWLASPLPRFGVRRNWPANVIPIGNAAAALEPVGGEGMGLAMRSAELAAQEVIRAVRQQSAIQMNVLRSQFERLWRTRRMASRAAAMWVSRPAICGYGLDWIASSGQLSRLALALVGK